MSLLVFILFLSFGYSLSCGCSADGTVISCLSEQNVSPKSLTYMCPASSRVTSIAVGFTVYCYRNLLSKFPNLKVLYVAGGKGSSCDCYTSIMCSVEVSNCRCLKTMTVSYSEDTVTPVPHSDSTLVPTVTSFAMGTTSVQHTSTVISGYPERKSGNSGVNAVLVALLVIALSITCLILILVYHCCYKKLRLQTIEQRRQMAINNATLTRELMRCNNDAGATKTPAVDVNVKDEDLISVDLGDSGPTTTSAEIHVNNKIAKYAVSHGDLGCSSQVTPGDSYCDESGATPYKYGIDNYGYGTPRSSQKLVPNSKVITRSATRKMFNKLG